MTSDFVGDFFCKNPEGEPVRIIHPADIVYGIAYVLPTKDSVGYHIAIPIRDGVQFLHPSFAPSIPDEYWNPSFRPRIRLDIP